MIKENKTSKYLLYAVGEIILVVIGILIALQINNWNEERKTQNNQEKYLILLKKEAVNNLKSLNKSQEFVTRLHKGQEKLMRLLNGDLDTITESYTAEVLLENFYSTSKFNYQNNVLAELKTTGELKNIANDSIRSQLMNQEIIVEKVKRQESGVYKFFEKANDMIEVYGSQRKVEEAAAKRQNRDFPESKRMFSNIPVVKMREFENITISYTGTTHNLFSNHYQNLEKHFDTLIKSINEELNQLK